jgi:hypothetical protein
VPTDDLQRLVVGKASTPASFHVPGNGQIRPKVITASFDGTGAAGSFEPTLKITSDAGELIGVFPTVTTVAAGGSARVTWFPGVTQGVSAGKVAVVGARIEAHGNQTINSGTDTDLTYDTVAFDTAGMANLVGDNRKLTVTTGGLYMVTCERAWPYNSAARRLIGVLHNGFISLGGSYAADNAQPAIWATPIGGAGQTTNLTTTLIQASPGDFFATGCNQDSGSNLVTGGGPAEFFSAILLGVV